MAEVENNTTKPKLEQEQVNESLIMLEAENKTTELDQVSNSWFKFDFIFKSQNWKNLMEIRNSQKMEDFNENQRLRFILLEACRHNLRYYFMLWILSQMEGKSE